jgi:hypothetical protein
MPRITNRLCGLCPEAHHMASAKALDALYGVEPPAAAKKVRELFHSAFFVADHATHFFVLAGPDLILGPDAPRATRTVLGAFHAVGSKVTRQIVADGQRSVRPQPRRALRGPGGRDLHVGQGLRLPQDARLAPFLHGAAGPSQGPGTGRLLLLGQFLPGPRPPQGTGLSRRPSLTRVRRQRARGKSFEKTSLSSPTL